MSKGKLKRLSRITGWLATVLTFLVGLIVGFSLFLYLGGVRIMYVVSNSMVPYFFKGDALLVSTKVGYIGEGDVIAYKADWVSNGGGSDIVTHRIVSVADNMITTKGDANLAPDPTFPISDVYGQVVSTYSYLGYLFNPVTVFILAGFALFFTILSYRWILASKGKHSYSRDNSFSKVMTFKFDKLGF